MPLPLTSRLGGIALAAGMTLALAACGGGGSATPSAPSGSPASAAYVSGGTIQWTGWPPPANATPTTSSFDIGRVDPNLEQYYIADRNNAGVSVIDAHALVWLRTAGAGMFQGYQPNGPGNAPATNAGPNGLVSIGNGIVFAGDGDSTLKVVNANTGALLATVPTVNPYTGPPLPSTCGGLGTPTTGTANQRVDEMDYDPADGVVLANNDAACPPFGTFFTTNPPYNIVGSVAYTTANGGAEQPRWDPGQHAFIVPFPTTIANPNGELDLVSPTTHLVTKVMGLATNCEPNGISLGQDETLFLGCSAGNQILTVNATTGATLNAISGHSGCDETDYNPNLNRFYAACSNDTPSADIVVADGSGNLIAVIPGGTGEHSVAVDPTQDHVFVPTQKSGVQVWSH